MRVLLVMVVLLLASCSTETLICGRMETLCGTTRESCEKVVTDTRSAMGEQGVADLKECFAGAQTCAEAGGCMAGKGLKAAAGQVEGFFKGLVNGLKEK